MDFLFIAALIPFILLFLLIVIMRLPTIKVAPIVWILTVFIVLYFLGT